MLSTHLKICVVNNCEIKCYLLAKTFYASEKQVVLFRTKKLIIYDKSLNSKKKVNYLYNNVYLLGTLL